MTTAYSKPLDELINEAQQYARELGTIPSQNKLKAVLHVRSERARTVLAALHSSGFDPAEPPQAHWPQLVPETNREIDAADNADVITLSGNLPREPGTDGSGRVPGTEHGIASERCPEIPESAPHPARTQQRAMIRNWFPTLGPARFREREPVPSNGTARSVHTWPIVLLAAPAMVAIWSGWVGLGALTGFGMVHPLPGIADGFTLNSAITLPVGVETYAAYALRVWLAIGTGADRRARSFAKWSAIGSLALGAAGQVAYHLMTAQHVINAPWEITTAVACLPVIVLGFGAALAHLQHHPQAEQPTVDDAGRDQR